MLANTEQTFRCFASDLKAYLGTKFGHKLKTNIEVEKINFIQMIIKIC